MSYFVPTLFFKTKFTSVENFCFKKFVYLWLHNVTSHGTNPRKKVSKNKKRRKRSKIAYVLLLMYHKFYLSNLQNDDKNWKIEPFLHGKQKDMPSL